MSKIQLLVVGVGGWIVVHVGLVLFGAVLGGGVTFLHFSGGEKEALRCQEDEVAVHGGLADWYDPDLPLECVNFDEFPEAHVHDPVIKKAWCKEPSEQLEICAVGETTVPNLTPALTPTTTPTPTPEVKRTPMTVSLTFYTCPPFCLGMPMYNGAPLHAGAVACGWALQEGQVFEFDGQTYTCEDRGGAVSAYWVDFWMPNHTTGYAWQARVGTTGMIYLERSN